jgi:O-antigen ligase
MFKQQQVIDKSNNKILYWLSFFMTFPVFLILGQNVSFFLMLVLFYNLFSKNLKLRITKVAWLAGFIALGAIISVIDVDPISGSLQRSLAVLPNFIYWCVILVVFSSYLHRVNMLIVYQGVAYGIMASVIYYYIQDVVSVIPFFRPLYGNSFAFLMICFSPVALYYFISNGRKKTSIILLIAILAAMLIQGRRAGFLLVSLEAFMLYFFLEIKARNILLSIFAGLMLVIVFNTSLVKSLIKDTNKRIYIILYETEDVATEDQSFLTRLAMVNKGLQIFEENPLTGVGLNNFSSYEVDISLDFEGGEVLRYKDLSKKSAHNSYIAILAEGGLLLFVPIVTLLIITLVFFVKNYNKIDNFKKAALWGFFGMCIHMYVISAIVNVFAWFLIAIATTFTLKKQIFYFPDK